LCVFEGFRTIFTVFGAFLLPFVRV
jgi:hypothetical protein